MSKKTREEMVDAIIEVGMYGLSGADAINHLERIWRRGYDGETFDAMTDDDVESMYRHLVLRQEENRSE